MKIDGIESEAIRPHRRARRHLDLLEYGAIAQWFHHLAPFRQDVREVPYPGSAIRKLKPDTMIIKRLYPSHLNISIIVVHPRAGRISAGRHERRRPASTLIMSR